MHQSLDGSQATEVLIIMVINMIMMIMGKSSFLTCRVAFESSDKAESKGPKQTMTRSPRKHGTNYQSRSGWQTTLAPEEVETPAYKEDWRITATPLWQQTNVQQ